MAVDIPKTKRMKVEFWKSKFIQSQMRKNQKRRKDMTLQVDSDAPAAKRHRANDVSTNGETEGTTSKGQQSDIALHHTQNKADDNQKTPPPGDDKPATKTTHWQRPCNGREQHNHIAC